MRVLLLAIALLTGGSAMAHQWTPTYPQLEQSYMQGILRARMELFNSRKDVRYYELGVYDSEWNSIPFAAEARILEVPYLGRKSIDVHIREQDLGKVTYICSMSKLLAGGSNITMVSSKICSKIK